MCFEARPPDDYSETIFTLLEVELFKREILCRLRKMKTCTNLFQKLFF